MEVADILREGIGVALKIGGPLLILSMAVGILVAIFQAVTQIHEQSLSFILKLIVVVLVLTVGSFFLYRKRAKLGWPQRVAGFAASARAMATRCCSPPDSSSGYRSSIPFNPTSSST